MSIRYNKLKGINIIPCMCILFYYISWCEIFHRAHKVDWGACMILLFLTSFFPCFLFQDSKLKRCFM